MTQTEAILAYMKKNGSITSRQAEDDLGCMRLASRISDLKKAGYAIKSELVRVKCRNGMETRVSKYSLAEVEPVELPEEAKIFFAQTEEMFNKYHGGEV